MKAKYLSFCLIILIAGCASQQSMYKKAKQTNTIEAYRQFLQQYPTGEYSQEIKTTLERLEYTKATTTHTITAYKHYLQNYPEGKFFHEAKSELEKLEFRRPLFWQSFGDQKIQWASRIIEYSSEYDSIKYSAKQSLGKPTVMPQGGSSKYAWSPSKKHNKYEFIKLGFEPMKIKQVVIAESYNPGTIEKVYLYDESDNEYQVYEGIAKALTMEKRMFSITFPLTHYNVVALKIEMNCETVTGWNHLDAIGISDSDLPIKVNINLAQDLKFEGEPENLGTNVNSEYKELSPKISPDGKTLFFTRKNYPENIGGSNETSDIWVSELDSNGTWQVAKNIGEPLNNETHNCVNAITPDGNTLLLHNIYLKDGRMSGGGISISHRTQYGWSFPEKLNIKNYYNKNRYSSFYLANDGKSLLMDIERDDTFGDSDIYVSFVQENKIWSEPLNLGATINTPATEGTPFLAADNKTLYFTSDGHPGFGSSDIYLTKRLDNTWQNWSEPQNLGRPINSENWDAYFTISALGDYAYLISSKNSIGETDIFRIKLPLQLKPEPVVLVQGKVYNSKTNKPIFANITYQKLPEGNEVGIARSDPNSGKYKIVLPSGQMYAFRAKAEEFIGINENMDLTDLKEYKEITKDLYLTPIEKGQTIRLNNIFFDFGKYELKEESFPELDRIAKILRERPAIEIKISGHTDNIGSDEDNLILSQNRAKSVTDYFISKGIDATRMITQGYGESKPISSNETDEGRQQNRRVEFTILKR